MTPAKTRRKKRTFNKNVKYTGTGIEEETEVVIRLSKKDQIAHIFSSWPAFSRRIERKHGIPKKTWGRDDNVYSSFWVLPLRCVSIRGPMKKKTKPGVTD